MGEEIKRVSLSFSQMGFAKHHADARWVWIDARGVCIMPKRRTRENPKDFVWKAEGSWSRKRWRPSDDLTTDTKVCLARLLAKIKPSFLWGLDKSSQWHLNRTQPEKTLSIRLPSQLSRKVSRLQGKLWGSVIPAKEAIRSNLLFR